MHRAPSAARATAAAIAALTTALWIVGVVLASIDGSAFGAVAGVGSVAVATVGALIVWQRPDNRLGWLFGVGGLLLGVLGTGPAYAHHALVESPGSLPAGSFAGWLADTAATPMVGLFAGVIPQLFPTGRPYSPRWRPALWAGWAFVVLACAGNAVAVQKLESVPGRENPYEVAALHHVVAVALGMTVPLGLVALVAGVLTLVLRWRRAAADERQQLKWFLVGVATLPAPLALHGVNATASNALFTLAFIVLPATLGVAVLRYRLYDLDLAVRRTVSYAVVTAFVVGLYLGIVAVAEAVVGATASMTTHVIAAVAAAAVFHPLLSSMQRAVDRLFHGDRSRPYDVVASLARRLEAAVAPETVLPGVVESVAEALRLPYVAIELTDDSGRHVAAEHGKPHGDPVVFDMTYQAEVVGRMLVCPRDPREALADVDRQLLTDIARHAGVAAHAVRTTTALLRSRAELVSAREEERRRLRRDLHDGLGPTLAGVTLGLHAAASLTGSDPDRARRLLEDLERQVEEAVADVRRLVYGLRPPALDEFGLVRAIQLHAARFEQPADGLRIHIDSPAEGLGPLPAAVEVAAYRIATEALTNVARHASATTCTLRFTLNGALEVEVVDDGRGFAPNGVPGVGLTAMRERVAELGGTLAVERPPTGARVRARLPIPTQADA
jgi:signal transduction histidine kinase